MTSVANSGMIWAQEMDIDFIGPEAAVAGTVSYVAIALGQNYYTGDTLDFSVNDLLACATHTEVFNKRINMKNALVDHNLVTRVSQDKHWDPHTIAGGEWIVFAVLNKGFVSPIAVNAAQEAVNT
jgi:hypothetical protein